MTPTRFLTIIIALCLGCIALFFGTPLFDGFIVASQYFKAVPVPAFYGSGFVQGSSGVLPDSVAGGQALFLPSLAQTRQGILLPDQAFPVPAQCGECHNNIYTHWRQSKHASSGNNSAYIAVKDRLSFEQGLAATRLCVGCHAPVALLTGQSDTYSHDRPSNQQGVSCSFCHSIDSIHAGNAGYLANPGRVRRYIGAPELARWLVWRKPNAHTTDWRSPTLTSGEVCRACHDFRLDSQTTAAPNALSTDTPAVVLQDTWREWSQSNAARRGLTCQSCHFRPNNDPKTVQPGEVATGIRRNDVLVHALGGQDDALPALKRNLGLQVSARASLPAHATPIGGTQSQKTAYITITNHNDAHSIPTGVGDLRQLWLEITLLDAQGRIRWQSGGLDRAGNIQAGSTVFGQRLNDAQGREITGHQVWRTATIASDTRLRPTERRTVAVVLPHHPDTSLRVRLLWRAWPAQFSLDVLRQPPRPSVEVARWPQ
jgi:hypothetical protein